MASHVVHRDIVEKDLTSLAAIVKSAKQQYREIVKQELAERSRHANATMFSPLLTPGESPDNVDRDWVLLPDEPTTSGEHRVTVHYQTDNKRQKAGPQIYATAEAFVNRGSDKPYGVAKAVLVWATPIDDPGMHWTLECWKVELRDISVSVDTFVVLSERKTAGNMRALWLAWVYDSKTQHMGLGVYATVSNSLFLSGYPHFYDDMVLKKAVLQPNESGWVVEKDSDGVHTWNIESTLRSGLKLYFSPIGVYLLDAKSTGHLDDLNKDTPFAWQKQVSEVISREDPAWIFDTLMASLEEEFLSAEDADGVGEAGDVPQSETFNDGLGRWRHWSYKKISADFAGRLQYDDCGVRCVTEMTRYGWTPYAFVCGVTPLPCFLHDRGFQWNSMKALAQHHQVASAKIQLAQVEMGKYLEGMMRTLKAEPQIVFNMQQFKRVSYADDTKYTFESEISIDVMSYTAEDDRVDFDTLATVHRTRVTADAEKTREQTYQHLLNQLKSQLSSPTSLKAKTREVLSIFKPHFEMVDCWYEPGQEDSNDPDPYHEYQDVATMYLAHRPCDHHAYDEMKERDLANGKRQKHHHAVGMRVLHNRELANSIMFVHEHGFITHDAVSNDFASAASEYPMQANQIITYANKKLLPVNVSVFIVEKNSQTCLRASLCVVPKLPLGKTLAISNVCAGGVQEHYYPPGVRVCPKRINQPITYMVDTLLGEMKNAGLDPARDSIVQTEHWAGGRCIFINDKSDAEYAIQDDREPPPFYMLLAGKQERRNKTPPGATKSARLR